jgi:FkbM family methyltransferase
MKSPSQIQQLQSLELQLFELFASAIENHRMIDVGAHQGDTLDPFVSAGWTVDAFEPIEANRNRMKERFASCETLIIHPEAVSNSSGYKDFHLALKKDGGLHEYYHSLERIGLDSYHHKGGSIKIQTIALDDLIRAERLASNVGFLKVDAEGHDLAVLEGASLLVADVIGVEFWGDQHILGRSPSPLAEMSRLLDARGYKTLIALCRKGEGLECRDSVSRISSDSWGNAFFFREEQSALGQRCAELLRMKSSRLPRPSRLPKIIRSFLPWTAFTFIDVEAHLGDFSQDVLEDFPSATGLLFEKEFNTVAASATTSLLSFKTPDAHGNTTPVRVETLDKFVEGRNDPPIGLLKVDMQGNDLKVLQGAKGIVAAHRPVILVKAMFVDLDQGQSSYYDIFELMRDNQYVLAAVLSPHATSKGIWVFADLMFVTAEKHRSLLGATGAERDYVRTDSEYLLAQNSLLQSACDERLELIHRLNATAEDRLRVIEVLDAEVRRLSGKDRA